MDWFMRSKEGKMDCLQRDEGGVGPRNGRTDNGLRLVEPEAVFVCVCASLYNNYRGKDTVFMVRL